MPASRSTRIVLLIYGIAIIVFLYLPLVSVGFASVARARFLSFPIQNYTTRWYVDAFNSDTVAELAMMTLVMSLTFKRMRTSFAVCFVMSAINEMLLMAGIISDTVLLKSPTTTREDIHALEELSVLSGRDYQEYGEEIFSSTGTLNAQKAEAVITADFKTYNEYKVNLGIGQVEVVTFQNLDEVREPFLNELESIREDMKLDWVMLLITNVVKEESMLFSTSYKPAEKLMVYQKIENGHYYLPGVLSRKKQLLPDILRVLEELRGNQVRGY